MDGSGFRAPEGTVQAGLSPLHVLGACDLSCWAFMFGSVSGASGLWAAGCAVRRVKVHSAPHRPGGGTLGAAHCISGLAQRVGHLTPCGQTRAPSCPASALPASRRTAERVGANRLGGPCCTT